MNLTDDSKICDREFIWVKNHDLRQGIVGCNRHYFRGLEAAEICKLLIGYVVAMGELKFFDERRHASRTLITEWNECAQVNIWKNTDGMLVFEVDALDERKFTVNISDMAQKENLNDLQDLAYWLSIAIYDESEADYFTKMALALSNRWNCTDVLSDEKMIRAFVVNDLVRIKREKIIERKNSLEKLIENLTVYGFDMLLAMTNELNRVFHAETCIEKRRSIFRTIEHLINAGSSNFSSDKNEEAMRHCKMAQIELRVICETEAERDWEIGYALINIMLHRGADYTRKSLEKMQQSDFRSCGNAMQMAAKTQEMSSEIMKFVGKVNRSEYNKIIRFKRGGSGGTDNDAHRQLKGVVNKFTKLLHARIAESSAALCLGEKSRLLANLDEINSKLLQQKRLFVVFIRWASGLLKQAPGHWHRGTTAYPGC